MQQWMRVFDDSSWVTKYFMALFITFFYIPFVLMFILCLAIFLKVPERTRRTLDERSNSALKFSIAIAIAISIAGPRPDQHSGS